jgi:hypothetical protein
MSEMISKGIKEAFTSMDPEMVAMRSQIFRQASLPVPPCPEGQLLMIEDRPRHPVAEVQEDTRVQLTIPHGRENKITVAEGLLHPVHNVRDYALEEIPPNYAIVTPYGMR